jgi:outer membrane protein assembly factor BamB
MARDGDTIAAMLTGRLVAIEMSKPGERAWDRELRDECGLAAGHGRVVWANRRGRLTCLESDSGKEAWTADGPHVPKLAATDGVVVAASGTQVAAYDIKDGRKLWDKFAMIEFSAVHAGAVLYGVGDRVTCLDAVSGATRWTEERNAAWSAAVQTGAIAGEHIVVNGATQLEFVNLRSGQVEGTYRIDVRSRGLAVSERFVLLWHGANRLTGLRIAD